MKITTFLSLCQCSLVFLEINSPLHTPNSLFVKKKRKIIQTSNWFSDGAALFSPELKGSEAAHPCFHNLNTDYLYLVIGGGGIGIYIFLEAMEIINSHLYFPRYYFTYWVASFS